MNKVLIVEDESIIALDIKRTLENINFIVTNTVGNYEEAIESVKSNKPDIIVMDINLKSEKDGIDTVKEIQNNHNIPVIYMTASCDEKTLKRAISTNPVSYLIKPIKTNELKANILLGLYKNKEKTRHYKNKNYKNIGFNYYFDSYEENLYYKDMPIKLSKKEKILLNILIQANGDIVAFKKLENDIWPNTKTSDSSLRTLIYRLRTKLEYRIIKTYQNIGCKINA